MKRFKFSLQPLQSLLERQEQLATEEYAQTVLALEQARSRLGEIERELAENWAHLTGRAGCGCQAIELRQVQAYCARLDSLRKDQIGVVENAQKQTDLAFAKLLAARKAAAVVEKYHEIQKKRFAKQCARQEQKMLDELSNRPDPISASDPAPQQLICA